MTDLELLEKVKSGLNVTGTYNDTTLATKTSAVKQYLLNVGISQTQIETELGQATITIGVNDIWNLSSGEVKFSKAFEMLLQQLQVVSERVET